MLISQQHDFIIINNTIPWTFFKKKKSSMALQISWNYEGESVDTIEKRHACKIKADSTDSIQFSFANLSKINFLLIYIS